MSCVLIAGVGAVASIGDCVDEIQYNVLNGNTGLKPHETYDCFAAMIENADQKDRLYKIARSSLHECIADAGWSAPMDDRTALVFASGSPDNVSIMAAGERFKACGRARPDVVYKNMYSYVAARLSGDISVQGPVLAVSAACAGSSTAIHLAHSLLESNTVDRVLCGGGEVLDTFTVAAFLAMQAVVTTRTDLGAEAVQPFGAERSGIALGEGCGWLALTRQGESSAPDGSNIAITQSSIINVPDATYGDVVNLSDWSRVIGSSADEGCDLLMAHATSTPVGDIAEGKAIRQHFPTSQVRSTKYFFGHTLSASTVLDVITLRHSMKTSEIPSMGHAYTSDPELSDLNISGGNMKLPVKRAVKLSAAFGGAMGKLVLETT